MTATELSIAEGAAPRPAAAHHLRTLYSAAEIARRVAALAAVLAHDYQGRSVHMVGVLRGGAVFLADLTRALQNYTGDVTFDFLGRASYGGTESTGEVRETFRLTTPIEGRDVLIVEDIIDTGLTALQLRSALAAHRPASLRLAVMVDNPFRRNPAAAKASADYVGFQLDHNAFVVGYGLDWNDRYRALPYIAEVCFEGAAPTVGP